MPPKRAGNRRNCKVLHKHTYSKVSETEYSAPTSPVSASAAPCNDESEGSFKPNGGMDASSRWTKEPSPLARPAAPDQAQNSTAPIVGEALASLNEPPNGSYTVLMDRPPPPLGTSSSPSPTKAPAPSPVVKGQTPWSPRHLLSFPKDSTLTLAQKHKWYSYMTLLKQHQEAHSLPKEGRNPGRGAGLCPADLQRFHRPGHKSWNKEEN